MLDCILLCAVVAALYVAAPGVKVNPALLESAVELVPLVIGKPVVPDLEVSVLPSPLAECPLALWVTEPVLVTVWLCARFPPVDESMVSVSVPPVEPSALAVRLLLPSLVTPVPLPIGALPLKSGK